MPQEYEPIMKSSLRSFMRALFTLLGIMCGLFLLTLLFSSTKEKLPQRYTVKVLANADGSRAVLPESGPVILQLNLTGGIGLDHLTTEDIQELLLESREGDLENDRVKGILMVVNTPGGTISDASGIYQALLDYKTRHQVPIIAYVDGISASGGVLVCCAADKIVATDVSLIGSVGVITSPFFNVAGLLEKLGVSSLTVFAGKDKDELNPFRPWSKTEGQPVEEIIHYYYDYFLNIVSAHRPMLTKEKLMKDFGAKVFPASIAQEYGYIDAAGYNRSEALKLLLTQAKIENNDYRVVELSNKGWMSDLFSGKSPLFTGSLEHRLNVGLEQHPNFQGKFLYLYRP